VDKLTKRVYASTMTFLCIVTILILGIIAMMIVPIKVTDFKDDKFPILTPIVKAGEQVQFHVVVTKYINAPATVSRHLVNDYIFSYTPMISNVEKGTSERTVSLDIPKYIEPGIYHIKTVYIYKINFMREVTYIKNTEDFEVVK
jgi:hypothetical protein